MALVNIVKAVDSGGTQYFPITHINAVRDSNGTTLNALLDGKANASTKISGGTGLSGGGDISTDVTLNLAMPTTHTATTYTTSVITSSEPIVYCLCKFTDNLNSQVCPVSNLADGQQCVVIYNNTGSTDNVTVSFGTTYLGPEGGTSDTSHTEVKLTVKKYGYGEVNFINIKGTIFLRGV
jgi:hypothetical protein